MKLWLFIKRKEDNCTPLWQNTPTAFSSTSSDILTSSRPINQSIITVLDEMVHISVFMVCYENNGTALGIGLIMALVFRITVNYAIINTQRWYSDRLIFK